MSWRRTLAKLGALFHKQDDLEEEIKAHLAIEEAENIASGMDPERARLEARRRFGNVPLSEERSRDMWTWSFVENLRMDVRYALRQLRLSPGFTAIAVLTLALGMGANTAMFSVVNAVLLQPLPFANPDRLVDAEETEAAPGTYPVNPADFLDWQGRNKTFASMSVYSYLQDLSVGGAGEPTAAGVMPVEANFFRTLGVSPALGRTFAEGEDMAGKNHVIILSFPFWQRQFAGDPNIIGKTLKLNAETFTVVGVMPPAFRFVNQTDAWTPLDMTDKQFRRRGDHGLNVVGRLRNGVTLAQARQDLLAISLQLEKEFPNGNSKVHAVVFPLKERIVGRSEESILVLLGAVGLVLLIACVNMANLLLSRAAVRQREIALRASLGAGRARLVRQLLTESVMLALAGGIVGAAAAWWVVRLLDRATNSFVPHLNPIRMDAAVLLFTLALCFISAVLFGLAPALQVSREFMNDALKTTSQSVIGPAAGGRRFRDVLIVSEIAITLALLTGAGLLLRSFAALRSTGIGVDIHQLVTATVNLPDTTYATPATRRTFFDALLARTQALAGVQSAAISTEIPLEGGTNGYINVPGATNPDLANTLIGFNYVSPAYFDVFGIPRLSGRLMDQPDVDRDAATALTFYDVFSEAQDGSPKLPANLLLHAIISRTAARTFWKGQNPLGRVFRWSGINVEVIGIVEDVKEYGIRTPTMPQAYFPYTVALPFLNSANVTLRSASAPAAAIASLRHVMRNLDPGLALLRARPMEQLVANDTRDARVQTMLLGCFASLALILAALGLYGVMSYTVTQRTREIGVRKAVGASTADVTRLVLVHGLQLTALGVGLGFLLDFCFSKLIRGLLFHTSPFDPMTFAGAAVFLAAVAVLAYAVPVRRATRIDPMLALRYE